MKPFRWSEEKNVWLQRERGISFERIAAAIEGGGLLDSRPHPNVAKYPEQRIFLVACDGYAYVVPYVETAEYCFLKTVIPSRKATREWRETESDDVQA